MSFSLFFQSLINGLNQGAIYALIALGYTMVYGIIRMINFAHGDFIMIGAYTLFYTIPLMVNAGMPAWLAVIIAIAVCAVVGVLVEILAYRPVRKAGPMSALITALAMSIFLENLAMVLFGAKPHNVQAIFSLPTVTVGGVALPLNVLLTIAIGLGIMIALQLFVKKTKLGKAMRAVPQDKDASTLVGINVNKIITTTFAIGSGLPIIMGVSFAYVPSMQAIAESYGIAAIMGAEIVGGIVAVVMGLLVKKIRVFFPPLITGTVVFTIGLSLYPTAINYMAGGTSNPNYGSWQNWAIAFFTLIVVTALNHFGKGIWKLSSILIGMLAGYLVSIPFGNGNHERRGYVIGLSQEPKLDSAKIKPFKKICSSEETTEEKLIALAAWMKERYGSTMAQALKTVLPVREKVKSKEKRYVLLNVDKEEALTLAQNLEKGRCKARARLLRALCEQPKLDYTRASKELGMTTAVITPLVEQGLVHIQQDEIYRIPIEEGTIPRSYRSAAESPSSDPGGMAAGKSAPGTDPRCHRKRQDAGLYETDRAGDRRREAGDRTDPGDFPDIPDSTPLLWMVWKQGLCPEFTIIHG